VNIRGSKSSLLAVGFRRRGFDEERQCHAMDGFAVRSVPHVRRAASHTATVLGHAARDNGDKMADDSLSAPICRVIDPRVRKAQEFIAAHFPEPISLSRLAREVGVSRDHLLRLFRTVGETPGQLLRIFRMKEAARMLAEMPEMGIKEIAWAVGCHQISHSHFSRRFKQLFGLSPSAYRYAALAETPRYGPSSDALEREGEPLA